MELDVQLANIEDWNGLKRGPVDILRLFNVFGYLRDDQVRRRIIQQCVTQWVKPGGWAAFVVVGTGYGTYVELLTRFVDNGLTKA